jgi:hypothetical protein
VLGSLGVGAVAVAALALIVRRRQAGPSTLTTTSP